MFDILLYLYDTYLFAERFPAHAHLARKLSAVGFADPEIGLALRWLSALDDLKPVENADTEKASVQRSVRVYSESELGRLPAEGRGFLTFLEASDLLQPHAREWIIERALALNEGEISGDRIKWVALLAIWKLRGIREVIWLEDLVRSDFSDDEGDSADGEYYEDDDEIYSYASGWQPTLH